MVVGILIAGVVCAVVGGIAANGWAQAQVKQAEAAGQGKGDMWRYLPWAVVAIIIVICILLAFLALRPSARPIAEVVGR